MELEYVESGDRHEMQPSTTIGPYYGSWSLEINTIKLHPAVGSLYIYIYISIKHVVVWGNFKLSEIMLVWTSTIGNIHIHHGYISGRISG